MTPSSSSSAYATVADLLARYDRRVVADLARDENERPSPAALETDARVLAALADASGEIEAACLKGGRYSAADLAALTGMSKKLLTRLTCRIALWLLYEGRDPSADLPPWAAKGQEVLAQLATGERIFAFVETVEAGVIGTVERQETDAQDEDRLVRRAERFFGPRGRQTLP
jgi:phage gp36-like protein